MGFVCSSCFGSPPVVTVQGDFDVQSTSAARIELRDLRIEANIGTYGPDDTRPEVHLLDLSLSIDTGLVIIAEDGMGHVFDYDPLILEIDRLAGECHYETQERLMTKIAHACAVHPEIEAIEICLRKLPVRSGNGSLGVRLILDSADTERLRRLGSRVGITQR
jgi:dihydroneopterin aldolase